MLISKSALIVLIFVLMFSVFLAKITNLITVRLNDDEYSSFASRSLKDNAPIDKPDDSDINNSTNHLMWFLQISDIHISLFHDHSRLDEFREFCDLTVQTIKPSVVVASGDLTDAKTKDNMGSQQFMEEWKFYKSALDECYKMHKTLWLDIRGNHDNFNVPSWTSSVNYYRNYSFQGRLHRRSYKYRIDINGDTYSFIALDACLEPGPRRPFNFVGMVTVQEADHIKKLLAESQGSYIIWFGHYPTSCILAPGDGVRALMSQGLAYLCGHFHMLGGAVPNMYTLQHSGFLELELGDWKDNRIYRLAAVDHGLFSFIDVPHRSWPVVLITNPKHALYVIPGREPLHKIGTSTHIRVLAFSLSPMDTVRVKIDDEEWEDCIHAGGPLFVKSWVPSQYSSGLHNIQVYVKDLDGREKVESQQFSLDGTRLSFRLLPRIVLMSNVSSLFQILFGLSMIGCIVPLCALKILHFLVKARRIRRPNFYCLNPLIRKLWILSTVDRLFYPLIIYPLYLTVGPWSIGEVIEGYTGIIFAWGTFVNGAFLPGSFTYAYGFLQMCTFQFPLTILLAHHVELRLLNLKLLRPRKKIREVILHVPFIAIISLQMMFAYFFWLAYGTMAFLLGPLRTWSILLGVFLWCQATKLPDKCLRASVSVWLCKTEGTAEESNETTNPTDTTTM